jgi:hypothetical protein
MTQRRWTKIGLRRAAIAAGLRVITRPAFYDIANGRHAVRVQADGMAYRLDVDLYLRRMRLRQVAKLFELKQPGL